MKMNDDSASSVIAIDDEESAQSTAQTEEDDDLLAGVSLDELDSNARGTDEQEILEKQAGPPRELIRIK